MMKHLFSTSLRAKGSASGLLLVLDRQQARLLCLKAGTPQCLAEGAVGPVSQHPVARALTEQLEAGFSGALSVVIGVSDQRVSLEALPKASRRDLAQLVRHRLTERFPDTDLQAAQALPSQDKGSLSYRLMAVAPWTGLEQWLAWLSDIPCPMHGLYLSSALVADAVAKNSGDGTIAGAATSHRIVLLRTADDGATLLLLTGGVLRLVRQLDPVVCGDPNDAESRAQALGTHIEQSRQWLQQQDGGHSDSLLLDILDEPEVMGLLASWQESDLNDGCLAQLVSAYDVNSTPPDRLADLAVWAALATRPTATVEPVHWLNRRRRERRTLHLGWGASATATAALVVMGWQAYGLNTELTLLRATQVATSQQQDALAQSEARRLARDAELQSMAGQQDLAAFEQRAQAYRALQQSPQAHEQTNELLRAVGSAIGRSSLSLQRLQVSHEATATTPTLELALALPLSVTRADAIAEIRHVTGLLEATLPQHEVSTTGLENLRNPLPVLPQPGTGATTVSGAAGLADAKGIRNAPSQTTASMQLIKVRVERRS